MATITTKRGRSILNWITDAIRIQSTGEERTKAGEWRKIPIVDGAREALAALHGDRPHLLPRIAPESLSRAFTRDAKRAGQMGHSVAMFEQRYAKWIKGADRGAELRKVEAFTGQFGGQNSGRRRSEAA